MRNWMVFRLLGKERRILFEEDEDVFRCKRDILC
jgi:hypothetical protein